MPPRRMSWTSIKNVYRGVIYPIATYPFAIKQPIICSSQMERCSRHHLGFQHGGCMMGGVAQWVDSEWVDGGWMAGGRWTAGRSGDGDVDEVERLRMQ